MSQTTKKANKSDRKKQLARIICLVLVAAMLVSSLLAAVLSQVF